MQTRLGSWIETGANIAVGFTINWIMNMLILPRFGFDIKPLAAFNMGLVFTVVSILRSYIIRRYFNGLRFFHHKGSP